MVKLKVAPEIIENVFFAYSEHEVSVLDIKAMTDGISHWFEFEIKGLDVPECEEVSCNLTYQHNRAHQVFVTMKFEKIK